MGMISEFKEFAMKGNMLDMAVGIIMGGAFGTVIKSLIGSTHLAPSSKALAQRLAMVLSSMQLSHLLF